MSQLLPEKMTIRIKKNKDGSSAMTCIRNDGTRTWQRQEGAKGRFFPYHDLTHYAVETVLGYGKGFYGLVAAGWDLADFGSPWPRGPLPLDIDPSEQIVGLLDIERSTGKKWTAAALNEQYAAAYSEPGDAPPVSVTDEQLHSIRRIMNDLFERWSRLTPGAALELDFTTA